MCLCVEKIHTSVLLIVLQHQLRHTFNPRRITEVADVITSAFQHHWRKLSLVTTWNHLDFLRTYRNIIGRLKEEQIQCIIVPTALEAGHYFL